MGAAAMSIWWGKGLEEEKKKKKRMAIKRRSWSHHHQVFHPPTGTGQCPVSSIMAARVEIMGCHCRSLLLRLLQYLGGTLTCTLFARVKIKIYTDVLPQFYRIHTHELKMPTINWDTVNLIINNNMTHSILSLYSYMISLYFSYVYLHLYVNVGQYKFIRRYDLLVCTSRSYDMELAKFRNCMDIDRKGEIDNIHNIVITKPVLIKGSSKKKTKHVEIDMTALLSTCTYVCVCVCVLLIDISETDKPTAD